MENEKLNINKELEKLEAKMGKIMADSAQEEIGTSKREINKLSMQIEDLLVHEAGFPPNIASTLVQNMHDKFTYEVGKNIASTRTNEYEESKHNLSTVEQDTPKGTSDKLESFSQDGVAINNRKYGQNLEQICEEVFREYKMRLSRVDDRRVEEAVYNIRKMVDRTSHKLQDMHEDFSRDIVKDVAKKVEELGIAINEDLLDKVEAEVVRIGQEHGLIDEEQKKVVIVDGEGKKHEITDPEGVEKLDKIDSDLAKKFIDSTTDAPSDVGGEDKYAGVDKAAKAFNDFAASLQNQTKSEEEISRSDAENLSDNQKAFKGDPVRDENAKKRLEDMFK